MPVLCPTILQGFYLWYSREQVHQRSGENAEVQGCGDVEENLPHPQSLIPDPYSSKEWYRMEIKDKPDPDPVAGLLLVDAYMRWALLAAEEVVGAKGMSVVLRQAHLERLINNYPPNELSISGSFTFSDYANLSAALLNFFGRAGKSMALRIGRISAQHGVDQQSATFGLGALVKASRLLPLTAQQKAGLAVMQNGFRKLAQTVGQDLSLSIEDRGDKLAYKDGTCTFCAGKMANTPICWVYNGTLFQSQLWLTGKEFEVEEVECRAMGAPACVWEISKKPKA
jgi:hypothetical protein